jgi:hypothetical protein
MKYSKLSILALATVGFFSACTKLDQDPPSALNGNGAVTEAYARILANGMYERMQKLEYYGRDFNVVTDLGGNDFKITSQNSSRFIQEFQFNYTPLLSPQTQTYLNAYRVVNQANVLIKQLQETDKTTTLRGEAYFLRALAHFDLVRRYTKPYTNISAKPNDPNTGITLVMDSIGAPVNTIKPGRSTLEAAYDTIINDLKIAQLKAPVSKPKDASVFRASQDAATALLCRVYLYKGEWKLAIAQADALMKRYSLWEASEITNVYNSDSPTSEDIFSLRFVTLDNLGSNNFGYIYIPAKLGGYGDIRLTDGFMNLLDPKDVRKQLTRNVDGSNYMMKFTGNETQGQVGMVNVKILRLSEVLLNRAEAYAELKDFQKATDDINLLRAKRGLDPFTDVANVEAEILKQRRIELVGEGHAMTDLFRKNGTRNIPDANALSTRKTEATDHRVAFPIPQAEMDANPNMVQNPEY